MSDAEIVIRMAHAYYRLPENSVGGHCHIALDDGNLDDDSLQWCREQCQEHGDVDGVSLMIAMLALSEGQRQLVYSRYDEYSLRLLILDNVLGRGGRP